MSYVSYILLIVLLVILTYLLLIVFYVNFPCFYLLSSALGMTQSLLLYAL